MSKMAMIVAGGVGFLLGSRAGRGPYERFSARAREVAGDPRVRDALATTTGRTAPPARDGANADPGRAGPRPDSFEPWLPVSSEREADLMDPRDDLP